MGSNPSGFFLVAADFDLPLSNRKAQHGKGLIAISRAKDDVDGPIPLCKFEVLNGIREHDRRFPRER